jgi:hypothetical protein
MKIIILILCSIFWWNISTAQSKILEEIVVDSVTSDFPVAFSFLEKGNKQFVAYYNKDRNLTIASRQVTDRKWTYKILPTRVGWDSHNSITMAIDRDNCIHVSGNMHNDSLIYFKTDKPYDITSLTRVFPQVSIQDELSCTYPSFMKDADGRLIYSYRKGGSGNGTTFTNVYDEKTRSFKKLTDKPLFDGMGEMSAYQSSGIVQAHGYFHLSWVWRDTPDCETNHDLSYARSKDLVHWETISGERIALPITPRKMSFLVDAVPIKGGIINGGWLFFFDGNKKPYFAYHKYDEGGISQLYIANYNNSKWQTRKLSEWNHRWDFTGPGSIESEIKLNNVRVDKDKFINSYWHVKRGNGELTVGEKTLTRIDDKMVEIPKDNMYPIELLNPISGIEGMSVKWLNGSSGKGANDFYTLRWETMGKRRFYEKREEYVPPTVMKLYKLAKKN